MNEEPIEDTNCVVCHATVENNSDRGTFRIGATETHPAEEGMVHLTCIAPKTIAEWIQERLEAR